MNHKISPYNLHDHILNQNLKEKFKQNNKPENKKKDLTEQAIYLQVNSIIGFLTQQFYHHWYSKKENVEGLTGGTTTWTRIDDKYNKNDIKNMDLNDLPKTLTNQKFYVLDKTITGFDRFTLSKYTKMILKKKKNQKYIKLS